MNRIKGYTALVVICLCYWILDSAWSFISFETNLKEMIFREPDSYIDTFLLKVPPYQVVSRLMVVTLFASLGFLIIEFFIKRQVAEKERKEAHDTFLTVLNSIDATIYVADIQDHKILFMNQHMIESFGGDYSGQLCHEVFRNSEEECSHCKSSELIDENGQPTDVVVWEGQNPVTQAWYVNYDRAIKWVDGRIVHLQIATDITRLKELQEQQVHAEFQLRQSQKMEAIGNLAGGIAHDFNNILSAILGYSELSLSITKKDSDAAIYIEEIVRAGNRAKDLVKQILTYARQSDDIHKLIRVDAIIKEVLSFIRSSIPTTIEIRQQIEDDAIIMGNATQIHQVMMNLCTNAAQAMELKGGCLSVEVKQVSLDRHSLAKPAPPGPGNYIKVEVSDTGYGIPQDIIDSIFEPYFTTKGVGEGTGMGLAVVHGIVKSCGGTINVESSVGSGTTFTIWLPAIKTDADSTSYQPESLPEGTEKILIVDDEPPIADITGRNLEQLGYNVTIRTSSNDALQLFKAKPKYFDLVISDMTMPNMTGDMLTQELTAIRRDIPVILCTGYSKNMTAEKAKRLGARAYLLKPLVKVDLARAVRNVLDSP